MKTLQEQFNLIKEGKGHKGVFLTEAKKQFPDMLTNPMGFKETTQVLKNRGVITENYVDLQPINTIEATPKTEWENKYANFLAEEAKAVEKKTSKEVEKSLESNFDYSDKKNLDNQIGQEVLNGIYFEAKQNPDKDLEEIRKIVSKNLEKDGQYYIKNAAFGVEGLGYQETEVEEVSGNHKSSGYSDKLKKVVKESLMGESYSEFQRDDKGAKDVDKKDKGEEDAFGAGVAKGEKIEKKKMKKETIDSKLAQIEEAGKITTLEAQIAAIEETMSTKEQRLSLVNEDSEMAELLDKGKVNQMRKEIKLLEKRANKMKKIYEKLNGSAYTAPIIDESDAHTFDVQSGTSLDPVPQKVGQSTTQE